MSNNYQKLTREFPDLPFEPNYELAQQTYFKIGGPAEIYVELKNHDQIANLHRFLEQEKIKYTILGGSSNVIVADEGVEGLVIRITDDTIKVLDEDPEVTTIRVGAGTKTALLVKNSIDQSLTGLEKFLGVPGTVGGAIFNNSHYLEELIGDYVSRVKVSDPKQGLVWLDQSELEFDYDSSRFHKTKEIILSVEFVLKKGNQELSRQIMIEASKYRANTQPLGLPSSGCIFQNVPNNPKLKKLFPEFADRQYISGGFLIDQAGLKGTKQGDIEVSHKHAAFFVNHGKGTAKDVGKLVQIVKDRVFKKFGINLKEEVFYLK